jgi:hypothetical protein
LKASEAAGRHEHLSRGASCPIESVGSEEILGELRAPCPLHIRLFPSLHRLLLLRRQQPHIFRAFVDDLFVALDIRLVALFGLEMHAVADAAAAFRLDFDDAYQYTIAGKYALTLMSFDSDFDRTLRGRKEPSEIP